MTRPFDAFLRDLRESAWFRQFVEQDLTPGIPEVKPYRPGDELVDWVRYSYMREGYLLAIEHFGIELRNGNHGRRNPVEPDEPDNPD